MWRKKFKKISQEEVPVHYIHTSSKMCQILDKALLKLPLYTIKHKRVCECVETRVYSSGNS